MTTSVLEPTRRSTPARVLGTLVRSRELAVLSVLILVVLVTTAKSHAFLFSSTGWRDLLLAVSGGGLDIRSASTTTLAKALSAVLPQIDTGEQLSSADWHLSTWTLPLPHEGNAAH